MEQSGLYIVGVIAALLFITGCILAWHFATRKMRQHDPKGKTITAFLVFAPYVAFFVWIASKEIPAILSSGNNSGFGPAGMILPVMLYYGVATHIIATVLVVERLHKRYLYRNIIVYLTIGLFISIVAMFAPYNNQLVLRDHYIIPYVKQSEAKFDLDRAKQLTHDPNLQTTDGMPLLPLALYYEKYDYADYLVSIGADVNFYDTYGERLSYRHGLVPNGMKQFVTRHNIPGFDFTARRLSLEEASEKAKTDLTKEITPDDLWEAAQAQLFVEEDDIYYVANNGGYVRRPDATEKTLVSVCTQSADAPYTVTFYLRDEGGRYRVGFLSPEDNYTMQFEKAEYPNAYLARGEDGMVYLCSGEKRLILEP